MCNIPDWETPSFCSTTWRRAAKPHRCEECDHVIEKGERYQHTAMKVDDVSTFKHCWFCITLAHAYVDAQRRICGPQYGGYGWLIGQLFHDIAEFMAEHEDLSDYKPPSPRGDVVMDFMRRE